MRFQNIGIIIFFSICFAISLLLMFSTFSGSNEELTINSKLWSDFASHLPLIRSFTFGWNFPVEYPIFAGEPIHYHFLFYAFVGLLEKVGVPLSFALNIPSAIGFFLLLYMVYLFTKQLFSSKSIGILTVLFFILNGSFSFIYFFQKNPPSFSTLNNILTNTSFSSFAPYYGEGIVSAFWNLNIYTNQRHFAAAFASSLFIIFLILKPVFSKKKMNGVATILMLGCLLGLSFYFHIAVFMMTGISLVFLAIFFPRIRGQIIILLTVAGIAAFPQYLYMNSGGGAFSIQFNPGYLISDNLTTYRFIQYWFMNLGLHSMLMILGFIFSDRNQKKVFLAFFSMFLIGNLFQFSPEMAANHKFFNFFMLIGTSYSAFLLSTLWKEKIMRLAVVILFFFLVLSGIIDLFPIFNDQKIKISDHKNNKTIIWIIKNTPQNSVFLNHTYLFAPESLAGRKIFLGWPYFAWSAGYDTEKRGLQRQMIFSSTSKKEICNLLQKNKLTHIEINKSQTSNPDQPKISDVFEREFSLEYKNGDFEIYNVSKNCN